MKNSNIFGLQIPEYANRADIKIVTDFSDNIEDAFANAIYNVKATFDPATVTISLDKDSTRPVFLDVFNGMTFTFISPANFLKDEVDVKVLVDGVPQLEKSVKINQKVKLGDKVFMFYDSENFTMYNFSLEDHIHSINQITNLQAELDKKANLVGCTFTGAVLGVAPTDVSHLTRKDFVDTEVAKKEPVFTKNTAFNKNFGTATSTVYEGNLGEANRVAITLRDTIANVDSKLALKDTIANVDSKLALKDNITSVDSKVSPKADKTYVDSELAKKVDTGSYNTTVVPIGGIIMFKGSSVGGGWRLCDGGGGTPDLRDKFVRGGAFTQVGNTGGSNNSVVVSHNHTATSSSSSLFNGVALPVHSHVYSYANRLYSADSSSKKYEHSGWSDKNTTAVSAGTPSGTVSTSTSTSVASSGVSGANTNLPVYYTLAYIMRIS